MCAVLDDPINGEVSYSMLPDEDGKLPYGTEATYSCLYGHKLVDDSIRICTGDGSSREGYFNGSSGICEGIHCFKISLFRMG